ncbi:MAG: efflux RND transporter periplasmic adaptor subunit [Fimbriimonadaceae bacterium]|nr:efflux RND transporter periplasmic adaptor subunit [Fimbriimonadaceae bacterium]
MKFALPVLCALIALGGCVDRAAQKQAKETAKIVTDPTTFVSVEPAKQEDVPEYLSLTGQITTSEDVTVGAKNAGRIVAVYVKDGDQVSAGQAIAVQETADARARLSQAQAGVNSARANLEQAKIDRATAPTRTSAAVRASQSRVAQARQQLAKLLNGAREEDRRTAEIAVDRAKSDLELADKNLARQRNLYKEGAVALTDVETAENKQANAMAAYKSALEQLRLARDASRPEDVAAARESLRQAEEQLKSDQATKQSDPVYEQRVQAAQANYQSALDALTLARQALADMTLHAPVSGRISGRPLQPGTYAGPGTAVAHVVGSGGAYFDAQVPEVDVSKIKPGQQVDVTVTAAGSAVFAGTVRSLDPLASSVGRVFSARIELADPANSLKPGMYASGRLLLGIDAGAVTVPTAAVLTDGPDAHVFVLDGDKAKRVDVKLVRNIEARSVVTGLKAGDQVIVRGQSTLVDGAPVKVGTEAPAAKGN